MAKYYPVVRWKKGEQKALKELEENFKHNIVPIIEFPQKGTPRPNGGKKREELIAEQEVSMRKKLTNFTNDLVRTWGSNEVLADIYSILSQTQLNFNYIDLINLFNNECSVIPLINANIINADLTKFIKMLQQKKIISAIAIRVDLNTDPMALTNINIFSSQLNIPIQNITMVYDLGNIATQHYVQYARNLTGILSDFGTNFGKLVILSGAHYIPQSLQNNSHIIIPRNDWLYWQTALLKTIISKTYNYGDYINDIVEFLDVPYQGAPKIKYTIDDDWIIYKGHNTKCHDTSLIAPQYKQMASSLVTQPSWTNVNCFGDNELVACANGNKVIGSPSPWVGIGSNRHISVVMKQMIANNLVT